ncbi:hypothetical protein NXY56_003220 [Leishmania guyanensis]|uniref:Uncharacterized protein n=2 Tax=Viannia TaxID=37616 RepID=A0A1E1IXI3_LEIGU|nr:unnamed protein product [Leishmania braziliensis]CAJ2473935.1 unnamed protein product [Leishmania braziliensis]CCM15902.1 hypothetical protein, unknown function [Leishmania guyanensis]SYZ66162.1 hypothetical_protein [Leishmania braziliensis MHOM/BR/75/M2904]
MIAPLSPGVILFGMTFGGVVERSVTGFTIFTSHGVKGRIFDIVSFMTVLTIFPSSRGAMLAITRTSVGLGFDIFGFIQFRFL